MKEVEVAQELINLVKESFDELEMNIDNTTDLSCFDLESLEFAHVFAEIEKKFNIEFEMDDLVDEKLMIIGNLSKKISELLDKNRDSIWDNAD